MMSAVFKGVSMIKGLVAVVCAVLMLPSWAQSQGQASSKTRANAKAPEASAQAKARAAADLTALLQARAIAQALAQAAAVAQASRPMSAQAPAEAAPTINVPAYVAVPQPTEFRASSPMQPLPAWTDVQTTRSDAPIATTSAVVPALVKAPALAAVQLQVPVVPGLAATAPVVASDPVSQDLAIAQQIHQGLMPCEMGASVRVEADAAAPGFFHVQGKGFRYRMYPVRTSTGALRLEDKKAGAVWLQLANKSMLMDQKKGRRVADECAHPEQVAYGQDMKTNPPPSLFDKTGMGRSND
ncbi:hypothetical protein [Limnohabitans sp. 63ED37-2]|uniref:hypothetical protein n=1 Tax=Limnohabitans sp. 63ED37-2 TaxID=1678128 RepID=UPI000705D169|nr:hypothetical protein L63ED372_01913 [Limnohabitans sp. 63ED37-2]